MIYWKEVPASMGKITDKYRDNLLGGLAIIQVGVLLSSSAIWGLVDDFYSMNGPILPFLFTILGIGSIIFGISILSVCLRRRQLMRDRKRLGLPRWEA